MPIAALKELIPPVLLRFARSRYGWRGNHPSWEDAGRTSAGYNDAAILERVRVAALKVKRGEAAWERDSVTFDTLEVSHALLAGLLWIAARNHGRLHVVDFGGSLGSTYFQHRQFLDPLPDLRWSVVEQKHFAECGRREFEGGPLHFYDTMQECLQHQSPDAILFSSVLQYIEKPAAIVSAAGELGFDHILVELTGFVSRGPDRITVQKVPPSIYPASYPCRIFNREAFLALFRAQYDLIEEHPNEILQNRALDWRTFMSYRGFLFRRKRA